MHALLQHLAATGFTGAPRAHGVNNHGREILDYIPGEVPHEPLPDYARTDQALQEVAALLRRYHDATTHFIAPAGADWCFPARQPVEVICHGDVTPYNCVFRKGRPVAFVDFDTAHPGPRIWDVAYAAYRFVPLTSADDTADQPRRLRLFTDAYGLGPADRARLIDTARERLEHLLHHLRDQSSAGHRKFASHVTEGDEALYRKDIEYLDRHRKNFR